MRNRFIAACVTVCVVAGSWTYAAPGGFGPQRIGAGLQYDLVTGDADNAYGAYLKYQLDLPDPMALIIDLSWATGEFDVPAGSGDYTSTALGIALVAQKDMGDWTPYAGAGGANHWNDYDNVNYDNKLSMFWLAGARLDLGNGFECDMNLRMRFLDVDSNDPVVDNINMDAIVFRVGVTHEL